MNVAFGVSQLSVRRDGYHPIAYTEGWLEVSHGGRMWVRIDEMLLIEFASALEGWFRTLRSRPNTPLYYASMDFEDAPLLAVRVESPETVYVSSAWADGPLLLSSLEEVLIVLRRYTVELSRVLDVRRGFDLRAIIERNIGARADERENQ
ncbi:MAG: hypothetical protein AAGA54_29875 [Myxococcota bacterium]